MDNYLVCVPPSISGIPPPQLCTYAHTFYTLSGRTGSALAWNSEGHTFASQSVQ